MPIPEPSILQDHVAVKACRHGHFMYNHRDQFIGRSLDRYGEWCEAEIEELVGLLQPGQICLDVGANIGTHTIPMAKKVGPRGRVLAFEPQRITFQMLCGNVALNGLTQVQCLPQAASATAGQVTLGIALPDQDVNFGAMGLAKLQRPDGEPVTLVRIDDLGLPACRLIKIDVEGMEIDVLQGAAETIRRHRPILFVENNRRKQSTLLIERVLAWGYTAWWHLADYYNPNNFFGNADNLFEAYFPEANMLCLPKDARERVGNRLVPVLGPEDHWEAAVIRARGQSWFDAMRQVVRARARA